ncbi:MAG: redoxin family protein [Planctomycetota bacterium]
MTSTKRTMMAAALFSILASAGSAVGQLDPVAERALGGASPKAVLKAESRFVDAVEDAPMPSLMPGDEAPELAVATFVKGAPISEFEEGTVYLVDFWATWCGPCIQSMPHLSSLQDEYADDNFRLVGVSIWERPSGDALVDHVTKFVDRRDDVMRYTVAIDDNGAMAASWMDASGQQGIPTAMLVDRAGEIAWIGYGNDPAMDEAVKAVVEGTWDNAAAKTDRESAIQAERAHTAFMPWYERFSTLAASGERDQAARLAAALFTEGKVTDPQALNAMAWAIVEGEGWDAPAVAVAKAMATEALEQLGWKDAPVLDTLAWAEHRLGNHAEAVRVQTMAVELIPDPQEREAYESALETFKKAMGG